MKNSGCRLINFGLESGEQEILNRIGKGITLEQVKKALALTRKVGINYVASFTVGMPGETKETIRKTVRMIKTFGGIDAGIYRITPYPGSPLYHLALKNNWLISKRWDMFDDAVALEDLVYIPPGWSHEEFQSAYLSARREIDRHFFLRRLVRSRSIFKRIPTIAKSLFINRGRNI